MKTVINTFCLFSLILIVSCKDSDSLFDPDFEFAPDPVITSIEPVEGYLAGIDSITIFGQNFGSSVDEVTVDFDGTPGIVLSATPTKLGIRPAAVVGENVGVKVSARNAVNFSNTVSYKLDEAIFPIPGYTKAENSSAIAVDKNGDIVFGLLNASGISQGIKVWRTDDTVGDYLPSQNNWLSLKFGPDDSIYGVFNNFGVYRELNGSIDTNPFAVGNQDERFRSIDFGKNDFLWVVGDNENIMRVDISVSTFDGSNIVRFPFSANLRAVRYYNDKLYVAGVFTDNMVETQEIWSIDVSSSDELTNPVQLYSSGNEISEEDIQLLDITFDIDGQMYLGTNTGSGVYTWSQEKGLREFYPGLISATGLSLSWLDSFLVASIRNIDEDTGKPNETRHPTKIDIRKQGAPYLGIE